MSMAPQHTDGIDEGHSIVLSGPACGLAPETSGKLEEMHILRPQLKNK
jgi:hypothetical protein